MTRKSIYVLTLFFFLFFSGSGPVAAEEINKNFHQSFDVKEGDSLCLRFGDGDVTIVPWEKNVIDVSVRYRADIDVAGIRLGGRDDFDVEFRQTGNTVYVTAKEPSSGAIGFYNKKVYEYVYEIHSPGAVHLDLEGDDGDVTIDQLSGNLTITLDDGDITLTACDLESCRVDGEDGEVRIRQSKGSFDITVDDGNVIMERIEARGLHISAAEGDIEVDLLAGPTLDADLKTEDGDIEIDLEKGFSISFQISADDPDNIRLDMTGIESFKEDRYGKSGSVNGGTGRLRVRTDEGDVTIREKS